MNVTTGAGSNVGLHAEWKIVASLPSTALPHSLPACAGKPGVSVHAAPRSKSTDDAGVEKARTLAMCRMWGLPLPSSVYGPPSGDSGLDTRKYVVCATAAGEKRRRRRAQLILS